MKIGNPVKDVPFRKASNRWAEIHQHMKGISVGTYIPFGFDTSEEVRLCALALRSSRHLIYDVRQRGLIVYVANKKVMA